jgi:hypothetical protein
VSSWEEYALQRITMCRGIFTLSGTKTKASVMKHRE